MPNPRKIPFATDHFYHVYNRGIERRPTFIGKREIRRALETLKYYRFTKPPVKLSKFLSCSDEEKNKIIQQFNQNNKLVEIIAFCLMPNHFHFLLKQLKDQGISKFISNFTNSYTKYFNTKNEREGPLFQGTFKAVLIETDEQLVHLSRYIHLNPIVAGIVEEQKLGEYIASSYPEYLGQNTNVICQRETILSFFRSRIEYKRFVHDQISYAKELKRIKHLALE